MQKNCKLLTNKLSPSLSSRRVNADGNSRSEFKIEKLEWNNDTNHYLYQHTPQIVKAKITKYLELGIKPTITKDKYEQFQRFCFEGDILIYPDKKNLDRANELYEHLTDAIAILSFVPGGIEIFGYHYECKTIKA